MKTNILFIFFLLAAKISVAQIDPTIGTWYNEEKDSKLQFFKNGEKLFCKVIWVDPKANLPKTDINNPNDKLKTQPVIGMVFLKNFVYKGENVWEDGTVYDPKNGKTYSGKVTIVSQNKIDLRGFIGISLIGRTSHFTRASN